MFIVGLMYEHGAGVSQHIPESLNLFDQAAALGRRYAEMEAKGMRLQSKSNRTAACRVGTHSPDECIRGGKTIGSVYSRSSDPFTLDPP
jgi:TPR repeat protein